MQIRRKISIKEINESKLNIKNNEEILKIDKINLATLNETTIIY